jgi:hypothetical protein
MVSDHLYQAVYDATRARSSPRSILFAFCVHPRQSGFTFRESGERMRLTPRNRGTQLLRTRSVRVTPKMVARVYLRSTPEQRIAMCLKLMAQTREHAVWWLFFRHLFDLAVLEAGR